MENKVTQYKNDYARKNYHRMSIVIKKEKYEQLKEKLGDKKVGTFINECIDEFLKQEKDEN